MRVCKVKRRGSGCNFTRPQSLFTVKSHIDFQFIVATKSKSQTLMKGSPQETIPANILKSNADLFCFPLTELFNKLIEESSFPDDMKNADVSSLFMKDDNYKSPSHNRKNV